MYSPSKKLVAKLLHYFMRIFHSMYYAIVHAFANTNHSCKQKLLTVDIAQVNLAKKYNLQGNKQS